MGAGDNSAAATGFRGRLAQVEEDAEADAIQ
jgi:hypothetical protein